jgi:membrane fusion protein, copper/silver efflux system
MRKLLIPLLIVLLTVSVMFNVRHMTYRAGSNATETSASKAVWTCPMDPQVQQDHPGKCPICGMNLVLQADAKSAETKMDAPATKQEVSTKATEQYQCPMHPTITRDHPGDCPICGMKLVKMKGSASASAAPTTSKKKIAFYRSPMDPKQTSPVPRKDEMGMDYVPVYEEETSDRTGSVDNRVAVTIDPMRQQLIGLRTASVIRSDISAEWQTVGRVQVDPTKVSKINVKVSGYVERVYVDFVGAPVEQGEQLFTYYSPDLLAAQQEYLLALSAQKSGVGDSILVAAARQKLRLWNVPDAQIERLECSGQVTRALAFVSPVTGVVTAKNIVEGSSLNAGEISYEISDFSTVWVMADAYQSDAARAKIGASAQITLDALPNRVFAGKVSFIDPVLDPQTRTFKVRIDIDNLNGDLKPDMFAEVRFPGAAHEALTIPLDAIIPSGQGNMVFVAMDEGKFEPRAVNLGEKAGQRVEVIDGLQEGELVVTRANFLIDSESSLRAALATVGGAQ